MLNRLKKYLIQRHRIPAISVLCLIAIYSSAQSFLSPQTELAIEQVPQKTIVQPVPDKDKKVITYSALLWKKKENVDYNILYDSVVFKHDGATLYCDSAYFNQQKNTFEAFSNVFMEQGDTLFLYGNYMHYDGNTKLVIVRENVRLEHDNKKGNPITLFTDSLNYDRNLNIGYYFDGGMLIDSLNELTSFWGQYELDINMALFIDTVKLVNPKFTLYSDTLRYNTETKIATITSPTKIVSDSGTIYTSKGWYNTATEESTLLDQSTIVNLQGDRYLKGDSIVYYRTEGYGEVFGNMFLQDTTKHLILRGNYGFYNERTDYALATDSAFCIEYSQGDSLYLHADTIQLSAYTVEKKISYRINADTANILQAMTDTLDRANILNDSLMVSYNDSIMPLKNDSSLLTQVDSLKKTKPAFIEKDSIQNLSFREIKAYYGVRFYRSDIQGVCDSMVFNSKDSILHLYKDPILWNTNRQLYGDTIDIIMNDSTIDYLHVKKSSFSIEQKDSTHYNQLKSHFLKVFFENKKVKKVLAEGNVESISYPEERNGELTGILYRLNCSYMNITMNDGAFEKLVGWPQPQGYVTPFHLVTSEQLRLQDFYWYNYLRPLNKDDIFRKTTKKKTDIRPQRSAIFDRED